MNELSFLENCGDNDTEAAVCSIFFSCKFCVNFKKIIYNIW